MAMTLKQASESVGVNKVTILRAIQKGRISAIKDEQGEWQIEPVELYRVYTPIEQRNDNAAKQHQTVAALEARITMLNEMCDLVKKQLEDARSDRDHWREQAMTALRQLPMTTPPPAPASRSWWRRAS
jgi:excisionase family DNA binding protein